MINLIPKTLIILTIMLSFSSCSTKQLIKEKNNSKNDNIFTINKNPSKSSELKIKASLKEHVEGGKSKKSHHKKNSHNFLINIDNQAIVWKVKGQKENVNDDIRSSSYLSYKKSNAESGEGVKYKLDKKIWLTPGRHKIFFALPEDNFYIEFSINTKNKKSNILELKPVYRKTRRSLTSKNFKKGILSYTIIYNGKIIN